MRRKITPFPGQMQKQPGKHNSMTYVLTDEQEAWLCRWFPEVENKILAGMMGIAQSSVNRLASKLGLVKSKQGMRGIKKRQAAHVKRLCEKNGYYDSLRGKPVSDACKAATARMWQEIREGKREHPAVIMKRKNPRKYKKWMENRSQSRKEVIRKERLRMKYDMPRQTRLTIVVLNRYTKSQTCHRYNALRRGYIVMEDCSEQSGERFNIYYDSNTRRTEQFEKNLIKDGFKIKQWNIEINEI